MDKYNEAISKYEKNLNDEIVKNEVENLLKKSISDNCNTEVYKTIYSCMDITTLEVTDNYESVLKLVDKVNNLENEQPEIPNVAAICVYPNFVTAVRGALEVSDVKVASVSGGFPSSQTYPEVKAIEAGLALKDGADELDIVMNVGNFVLGNYEDMCDEINEVKEICGDAKLKVILETGALKSYNDVRKAAILSIYAGADFIKTSTGKIAVGATPEAFYTMCNAVKDYYEETGTKIGVKAAGGIRTAADAVKYYTIVKEVLGEEWLNKDLFRIGAASLADNLIAAINE
ncbi:MAG: deoxyribose-phosphate aldolase [Muribaculaceae bacterium]|nr:deoxyribose-phosphate aldolase [Muribaculaceae bacterium]